MTKRAKDKLRDNQGGVALILALLFVVLLSALVVEFAYDAQVDASLATNFGRDFEAYLAAKSAVHDGMGILREHLVTYFNETAVNSTGQAATDYYDGADQQWYTGTAFTPMNDATMRTTIRDEYGKMNLNALVFYGQDGEPQENEQLINALLYLFEVRTDADTSARIVDCILDWIDHGDEDDDERDQGAENDYYMGLESPFSAKNGPMDSIEELLLIPGITADVYYGDPTVDPPQLPLPELLTVHGNLVGDININTAQPETIEAMAFGFFGDNNGQQVLDALFIENQDGAVNPLTGYPIFYSQQQLTGILRKYVEVDPDASNAAAGGGGAGGTVGGNTTTGRQNQGPLSAAGGLVFITTSNVFRIHGDGKSGEALVRIEAYVFRSENPHIDDSYILPPGVEEQDAETALPAESMRILDWKVIR